MLTLPKVPYEVKKNNREIVSMRGINYSDRIHDGDMADSLNISAKRYPYITTRRAREQQTQYSNVTALTAWEKLVAVQGTDLLYDGEVVGRVSKGEKQFAMINTKLVIYPDKKYLDMNTLEVKNLWESDFLTRCSYSYSDGGFYTSDEGIDFTTHFQSGDVIFMSGTERYQADNLEYVEKAFELEFTAKSVSTKLITTDENVGPGYDNLRNVTITHKHPEEIDFICESENRLWGCSNKEQTIYVSALGEPDKFYDFKGVSTDSFAVAVGSVGNFTGCCKYGSSVLFWKETCLHKMLGSFPAEFTLYTYNFEGLQAGCHKSLQTINEILFYKGLHGVYAYSGATPSLISSNFGQHEFTDAVGGTDGDSYYLSVKEGDSKHLFVYEINEGIWIHEDNIYVTDFARIGKQMYFLSEDGTVWLADAKRDDADLLWHVQFTPFYETVKGRKAYSKLTLRLELPKGSYLIAQIRQDGKMWREAGKVLGKEHDTVSIQLAPGRCDKFELRLSGKGPCTILSILRDFSVGSDV